MKRIILRKTIVACLFGAFMFQIIMLSGAISVQGAIATSTKPMITVYDTLVNAQQTAIITSSRHAFSSNDYSYSGIKVQRAPSIYMNTNDAIFSNAPVEESKDGGGEYQIYHALIPYEYDYNVYTDYGLDIVGESKLDTQSYCIGRFYEGYQLTKYDNYYGCSSSGVYQASGWNYADFDIQGSIAQPSDYVSAGSKNDRDVAWKGTGVCFAFSGTDKCGDDGENDFVSTKPTKEWWGSMKYVNIKNSKGSYVGSDWTTAFNTLKTNVQSKDIGAFAVEYSIILSPDLGIEQSFNIVDGQLTLNRDSTWVRLNKVELVGSSQTGFIGSGGVNFITNPPTDKTTTYDKTSGSVTENTGTKDFDYKYTTNPNPFISTVDRGQNVQGTTVGASNPVVVISDTDGATKGKELRTLGIKNPSDSPFNLTSWIIQIKGYHLTPEVVAYKKSTTVNYVSEFYDNKANSQYKRYPQSIQKETLAGWTVQNSYSHDRLRVWVDVYSKYYMEFQQPIDNENQSIINPPQPRNPTVPTWDTVDTATTGGVETVDEGHWYDGFLTDLNNIFGSAGMEGLLYTILIIGAVALAIYIGYRVIISGGLGGLGGGSGGNDRQMRRLIEQQNRQNQQFMMMMMSMNQQRAMLGAYPNYPPPPSQTFVQRGEVAVPKSTGSDAVKNQIKMLQQQIDELNRFA